MLLQLSRSGRAFSFPAWELHHSSHELIQNKTKQKKSNELNRDQALTLHWFLDLKCQSSESGHLSVL